MNKAELIATVAEKTGLSKKDSEKERQPETRRWHFEREDSMGA